MVDRLLTWARRNTRRAVALALAPGLVMLAVDAGIGHFMGHEIESSLQYVPVIYGGLGFLVLCVVVWPKVRSPFAWSARILGALGVVVGLAGTFLHLQSLMKELDGNYSWPSIEGGLSVAPPVFAPLAFVGVGALLFLLPSTRLMIRFRVGRIAGGTEARRPVALPSTHKKVG